MLEGLAFHIITFGCQMNKSDSERIAGLLESLGMTAAPSTEQSDVVVFLTCCVREKADVRLLGQVSSMKGMQARPGSRLGKRYIAIGGCIGQRDGQVLVEKLPHVDIVFGTHNLEELPHLLQDAIDCQAHAVSVVDGRDEFHDDMPEHREHSWAAWLPITVGCNNFCTYCIVPYVRGREVSKPLDEIRDQALRYVESGVQEITLLGQNVNSYGRDLYGEPRFCEVLDAVSDTGVARIRFATSHPKDLSDGVIERFATLPNLMPSLHLPVQSGSDRVLHAMNRRYTVDRYRSLVAKLRSACPDIALSTDVIVGFPGETEEDFLATYQLIEEIGYHQVFTFIYSKREGTPAARIVDETPHEVIQDRFDRLVALVQDSAYKLNQPDVGLTVPVLVEGLSKRDSLMLSGKTPRNQTVHAPISCEEEAERLTGRIVPMHIEEARTWYLRGTVVDV